MHFVFFNRLLFHYAAPAEFTSIASLRVLDRGARCVLLGFGAFSTCSLSSFDYFCVIRGQVPTALWFRVLEQVLCRCGAARVEVCAVLLVVVPQRCSGRQYHDGLIKGGVGPWRTLASPHLASSRTFFDVLYAISIYLWHSGTSSSSRQHFVPENPLPLILVLSRMF